jgi:hypothetical protein
MLTVILLLALCNIHGLESKSIDFILAFPQADLDVDIWMELPTGIVVSGKDTESRAYVLKLKKSLYGLKQASLNWFEKLKQGLMDQGFTPPKLILVCISRRTWFSSPTLTIAAPPATPLIVLSLQCSLV